MERAAVCRTIEQACQVIHDPTAPPQAIQQADAYLKQFVDSTKPYDICLTLLRESNNPIAHFQALCALRTAALREWRVLTRAEVHSLRSSLLSYATQHLDGSGGKASAPAFLRNQTHHVVAVLFKRGWGDDQQQGQQGLGAAETLVQHLQTLMAQAQNPQCVVHACELIKHLLVEFALHRSSELGVPWGFHLQVHRAFEQQLLPLLFNMIVDVLRAQNQVFPNMNHDVLGIASTCLAHILQWRFDLSKSQTSSLSEARLQASSGSAEIGSDEHPLQPGPQWTSLLVNSHTMDLFFQVYERVRQCKVPAASHPLRAVFQQLASMQGSVFPRNDPSIRAQYVTALVTSLLRLVVGPVNEAAKQAAGGGASLDAGLFDDDLQAEIADICAILHTLIASLKLDVMMNLGNVEQLFTELTNLTAMVMGPAVTSSMDVVTTFAEAFDHLVDAWAMVIERTEMRRQAAFARMLEPLAARLFHGYVESRLAYAKREISAEAEAILSGDAGQSSVLRHEQFHDEMAIVDQLNSIATIGRLSGMQSLSLLHGLLTERIARLREFLHSDTQQGGRPQGYNPNLALVHEELYWLVQLAGHVLADAPNQGEVPLIPTSMMRLSQSVAAGGANDPVVETSATVFNLVDLHCDLLLNKGAHSGACLSPLTSQALVWFMERWASSYLMPMESHYMLISPSIWRVFGQGTEGSKRVLEAIFRAAAVNLLHWTNEDDLVAKTAEMLHTLVKNSKIGPYIRHLAGWHEIMKAHAQPTGSVLMKLRGNSLSRLIQVMCQAATAGGADPQLAQLQREQFTVVIAPIQRHLLAMVQHPNFVAIAQTPEGVHQAKTVFDMLRGVALAQGAVTFDLAFEFLSGFFSGFVQLVGVFSSAAAAGPGPGGAENQASTIVTAVVRLFRDMAEVEVVHLGREQSSVFMRACLEVVRAYGQHSQQRLRAMQQRATPSAQGTPTAISINMVEDAEEDLFEDLATLLELLVFLADKDMYDLSDDAVDFASSAVYAGLCAIVPNLSERMFQYPRVYQIYYELLCDVVTTYPAKLAVLDNHVREGILHSIRIAVTHHDPEAVRLGLDALGSIAEFHLKSQQAFHADQVNAQHSAAQANLPAKHPGLNRPLQVGRTGMEKLPPSPFGPGLVEFMRVLINMIIYESVDASLISPLANALLPILVVAHGDFQAMARDFVSRFAGHGDVQQQIATGFQGLVHGNGVNHDLTAVNRRKFRANLEAFCQTVRPLLRKK